MTLHHLASTPPMGWNLWNTFGHNINESVIRETADALVFSGPRDCGYEYIIWMNGWSAIGVDVSIDIATGLHEYVVPADGMTSTCWSSA